MIGIFQKLFKGRRDVSLDELKSALRDVERDRRRKRIEVRRWERKRKQVLDQMKTAQSQGNSLEVDYLWEDFKEHRRTGTDMRREGRIYNIEGVALKRYIRALERLEKKNDRTGARHLLERIQGSGLMERLSLDREAESQYLEEMNAILGEFEGIDEEEPEDPEKVLFLSDLASIQQAEAEGDDEEAREREEELIERFDNELTEEN